MPGGPGAKAARPQCGRSSSSATLSNSRWLASWRPLISHIAAATKRPKRVMIQYTCNWADEAVRKLKDRSATAEEEGLTEDCSLKLLHFSQGLSDEMRTYELFYSATGFPGDLKKLGKLTINENKKIDELKEQIKTFCTKENGFETPFELDHMIVRKLNKLNRPCKVLGENNKTIKRLKVNCIGLVFTILDHKVVTDPNDLRLFICERKGRFYSTYDDLVLHK